MLEPSETGIHPSRDRHKLGLELNPLQKVFFPVMLKLAHFIFAQSNWKRLQTLLSSSTYSVPQSAYISQQCTILTKRPSHIAFAIVEDFVSYKDVSKLVAWAIALGSTRYVSVFDRQGQLKRNQDKLILSIRTFLSQILDSSDMKKLHINWHNHLQSEFENESLSSTNGHGNNSVNGNGTASENNNAESVKTVHVSLLSPNDGKPDIVRTARKLAVKVKAGHLSPDEVDETLVTENLSVNRGLADPELLIRLGMIESNMGFLPWQIRLTEIHSLPTHKNITFQDFFGVLKKYSKCEQRFGT